MDPDFTALASRLAARAEVLGCVILSRDGLVLGAFPPNGEQDITPGLLRFAALGDPERGFAQFSDELWAFVRAGAYAAFAVAEHGTRPGVLLDYLEQALLVAEEARQERSAVSEPAHVDLQRKGIRPGRKLRAASSAVDEFRAAVFAPEREVHAQRRLERIPTVDDEALDEALAAALADGGGEDDHVEDEPAAALEIQSAQGEIPPELVVDEPSPQPLAQQWADAPAGSPDGIPQPTSRDPAGDGNPEAPAGTADGHVAQTPQEELEHGPEHGPETPETPDDRPEPRPPSPPASPDEIDRIALAREFAQLLQEGPVSAE